MVEAQLNIYHHFCSQTGAWGPNQLEVHVLLSDLMSTGDRTLGPTPTAWLLPLGDALTAHRRRAGKGTHTEWREATDAGGLRAGPTSTTLGQSLCPLPLPLSPSPLPSLLIFRVGLALATTQDWGRSGGREGALRETRHCKP